MICVTRQRGSVLRPLHPLRQFGDIGRNPAHFVARHEIARCAPVCLFLVVDVRERLTGGVLHEKAGAVVIESGATSRGHSFGSKEKGWPRRGGYRRSMLCDRAKYGGGFRLFNTTRSFTFEALTAVEWPRLRQTLAARRAAGEMEAAAAAVDLLEDVHADAVATSFILAARPFRCPRPADCVIGQRTKVARCGRAQRRLRPASNPRLPGPIRNASARLHHAHPPARLWLAGMAFGKASINRGSQTDAAAPGCGVRRPLMMAMRA